MNTITIRLIDGELKTLKSTLEPIKEIFDICGDSIYIGRTMVEFKSVLNYLRGMIPDIPENCIGAAAVCGLIENEEIQPVAISIGGIVFHISKYFLKMSTYFTAMLEWQKHKNIPDSPVIDLTHEFIDRDPDEFKKVLAYLEGTGSFEKSLEVEFEYFGIVQPEEKKTEKTEDFIHYPKYSDIDLSLMTTVTKESNNLVVYTEHLEHKNSHSQYEVHHHNLARVSDTINSLAIEANITHDKLPTIEDCYEFIDKITVICGGSTEFSKTTGKLLRVLCVKPTIVSTGDNTYTLHIPLITYFTNEQPFLLISTYYDELVLHAKLNNNFLLHELNLVSERGTFSYPERNKHQRDKFIQNLYVYREQNECITGGNKTRFRLYPAGYMSDIFVCLDIDLVDIEFIVNGYKICYMTKATLLSMSHKYFGMLPHGVYGIRFPLFNASRIDSFICEIQHENKECDVSFIFKVNNELRYLGGLCSWKYSFA